jgi:hypothetical protein
LSAYLQVYTSLELANLLGGPIVANLIESEREHSKMTQKSELADLVRHQVAVGERFTLDTYQFEEHFRSLHPFHRTPRNQLRYIMQSLRDIGMVRFVDNRGTFERASKSGTRFIQS